MYIVTSTERAALTIFAQGKEGHSPHPRERVAKHNGEQPKPNSNCEVTTPQNRIWLVKARENITLAPRYRHIVVIRLEAKDQALPPLVCEEPARIPIERIFPARALSRVEPGTHVFSGDDTK
jgi:hypothetical protein